MKTTSIRPWATLAILAALAASPAEAATLSALTNFGGGDGWLAPAEATHLQGASLQRGLTYNAANNHLYVVDRNGGNFIRILDGTAGALLGSLDMTGVAGGTFAINMIDVDDAGIIYACTLNGDSDVSVLKVYRWATEASTPTVAYDSTASPINNGADIRVGDDFAVIGSGASTRMVSGGNIATAGGNPGDNAFVMLSTADGLTYSAAVQDFIGTEPANGAMRLGIDFVDADTVIGRQASGTDGIVADFVFGTATLVAMANLTNSNESILAIDRANNLMATGQLNTGDIRLYGIADPDNPVLMDTKNLIVGAFVANGNGTGDLKFGNGKLYALVTNNGIQAWELDLAATEDADFDDNTIVGDADFDAWTTGFGTDTGATHAGGDANADGAVNGLDFLVWQRQFNETSLAVGAGGVVPEPAGGVLGALAACGLAAARRDYCERR